MKLFIRKQLLGAVEHGTSGRYHNLFDSDAFGENPLWVIFTRKDQQWKALHWGHTTYSNGDSLLTQSSLGFLILQLFESH